MRYGTTEGLDSILKRALSFSASLGNSQAIFYRAAFALFLLTNACTLQATTFKAGVAKAERFFHGPGIANWDLGLMKNVQLTEAKQLELRAEFYNIFNHAQFGSPEGDII